MLMIVKVWKAQRPAMAPQMVYRWSGLIFTDGIAVLGEDSAFLDVIDVPRILVERVTSVDCGIRGRVY